MADFRYRESMKTNGHQPAKHTQPTLSARAGSSLPALTALPTCPASLPHTEGAHKVQVFHSKLSIRQQTHHFFTVWSHYQTPMSPPFSTAQPSSLLGLTALPLAKAQRCCPWPDTGEPPCREASSRQITLSWGTRLRQGCLFAGLSRLWIHINTGCSALTPDSHSSLCTCPGHIWSPGQQVQEVKPAEN